METSPSDLPISTARRVARLARLALTDAELEKHRTALSAVLGYVETLRELDLTNTEPLAHPQDVDGRLDTDTPRTGLATAALLKLAPATDPPYLSVPKVLDGDPGA